MAALEQVEIAQRQDNGDDVAKAGADALHSLIPNILVIDDEPLVRSQLSRLYEQSGYRVKTAGSAEEALVQLAQGGVDFVITDIKLPRMSGAELIALMHDSYPDDKVDAALGQRSEEHTSELQSQ